MCAQGWTLDESLGKDVDVLWRFYIVLPTCSHMEESPHVPMFCLGLSSVLPGSNTEDGKSCVFSFKSSHLWANYLYQRFQLPDHGKLNKIILVNFYCTYGHQAPTYHQDCQNLLRVILLYPTSSRFSAAWVMLTNHTKSGLTAIQLRYQHLLFPPALLSASTSETEGNDLCCQITAVFCFRAGCILRSD